MTENLQVNDFKIVRPANLERKQESKVIGEIGANGNFNKKGSRPMTIENAVELNNRVKDQEAHPEMIPGLLVPMNGKEKSVLRKIDATLKLNPEVGEVKEGYVQIFPNFTGKKFIGGKNYIFEKGKGAIVPKDVRDILDRGRKLLFV